MNVNTIFQLLVLLSFILCISSLNCPSCSYYSSEIKKAACTSHFAIIGKVTEASIGDHYVYYTLGYHKEVMARNDFSRAEKIIRTVLPYKATNCNVPDTEFLRGHYYLLIGNVVSDGLRNVLEVNRCNYMDMEEMVSDESKLNTLKDLYRRSLCNAFSNYKTGSMNNVFQKNNRL